MKDAEFIQYAVAASTLPLNAETGWWLSEISIHAPTSSRIRIALRGFNSADPCPREYLTFMHIDRKAKGAAKLLSTLLPALEQAAHRQRRAHPG